MNELISKMNSLQTSFQTIQNRAPYKPKVTPHRSRHYAKECEKRIRDEEQAAQYNSFTIHEEQEEQFPNDELDIDHNTSGELNY